MFSTEQAIEIIDLLMSEYSWSFQSAESFLYDTPFDIVEQILKRIYLRKNKDMRTQAFYIGVAAGAVMASDSHSLERLINDDAKDSDNLDEVTPEAAKGQLKAMWVSMGRKPEDFETAFASGKIEF